jgi:hypothetical protein
MESQASQNVRFTAAVNHCRAGTSLATAQPKSHLWVVLLLAIVMASKMAVTCAPLSPSAPRNAQLALLRGRLEASRLPRPSSLSSAAPLSSPLASHGGTTVAGPTTTACGLLQPLHRSTVTSSLKRRLVSLMDTRAVSEDRRSVEWSATVASGPRAMARVPVSLVLETAHSAELPKLSVVASSKIWEHRWVPGRAGALRSTMMPVFESANRADVR